MSTNRTYLVLAIILLLLSAGGVFLYIQSKPAVENTPEIDSVTPVPTVASFPTSIPSVIPSVTLKPSISATPSAKVTPKLSPVPTVKPTATPTVAIIKPTITPVPTVSTGPQILKSDSNKFQVTYSPARKLYQDKEGSGDRYTLYSSQGNFAIHVGPDWSWTNTSRQLSSNFLVAGKNTYVYEISSQKIVDLEANGLKYSIQCVHNGIDSLKKECDQLIADFKLI